MTPILFTLPGNGHIGNSLVSNLGAEMGAFETRQFPDGETYIRLETDVKDRPIYIICSLDRPNEKITPLILFAAAAKDLGARSVRLICPYLAYMRQDKRFQPGEGVTSRYFASLIGSVFDGLLTIDPHLHRYASLSDLYAIPAKSLHAAPLVSSWIRQHVESPILIGPDSESEQWVSAVAKDADAPYIVLEKNRRGDRDVDVSVPDVDQWSRRTPVLVDDIISTARTMIETVGRLKRAGMRPPVCIGVHGVFADNAYEDLQSASVERIVTCNTITHPSNAIDLTGLLADGVRAFDDEA
jgi:ribose-phosphate pyrophosphokinase